MSDDVRDPVANEAAVDTSTTPLPEPTAEEAATPNPAADTPETDAPVEPAPGTTFVGAGPPAAPGPEAPDPVNYKDRWLRTEADLQNVRRRATREREDAVARAEEAVLLDVIGLLDDLDRAIAALAGEQAAEAWAQGVALTAQRMRDTLARHGVTPIAAVGQPFDPLVHEALLEIPAPDGIAPGCVAQEIAKGWQRGARALRAARVVVARERAEG